MEGELLGSFNDDVVARRVPSYHMMVFGLFKETARGRRVHGSRSHSRHQKAGGDMGEKRFASVSTADGSNNE